MTPQESRDALARTIAATAALIDGPDWAETSEPAPQECETGWATGTKYGYAYSAPRPEWTGRLSPEHPANSISDDFGAHAFGTDGGATGAAVTDHSLLTPTGNGYLDRGTESLDNVAFATTGHGDRVYAYVPPEPTPFQEAILDGATHGHG